MIKLLGYFIAFSIACLIGGALDYWYNTIFYHVQLPYWRWVVVSAIIASFILLLGEKQRDRIAPIFGLIFIISVVVQVFKWLGWFTGTLF